MLLKQTLGSFLRCQASARRWLPSTAPRAHQLGSCGFASHQASRLSPLLATGPGPTSTSEPTRHADKAHRCHQRPQAQRAQNTCCHATSAGQDFKDSWEIKMLYDGDCPLCMREVNMLRKRDKSQHKIGFVDISSQDYSPKDNAGISYEEAMGSIHGILPGDKVITNVDVFRKLYEVVGLGWVYAVTRISFINKLANRVYALWAKYRLPITGRPDIDTVLRQRKETCKGS
ncbi:TPA: hypothetical protein ACH3X1_015868 [Trebouxia sp. C0004]